MPSGKMMGMKSTNWIRMIAWACLLGGVLIIAWQAASGGGSDKVFNIGLVAMIAGSVLRVYGKYRRSNRRVGVPREPPESRRVVLLLLAMLPRAAAAAQAADTGSAVELSSDDTAIRVEARDDQLIVTSLVDRADEFDWIRGAADPVPMPLIQSLEIAGKRAVIHWRFAGLDAKNGRKGAKSLRFRCDRPSLELVSTWSAAAGPGPIEHELVVFNRGNEPVMLPAQDSLALRAAAPVGHTLEQWWVDKGGGRPTAQGTHHQQLSEGTETRVECWPSGRDTPRDAIPWTTVQDVNGRRGFYAGIEFTARLRIAVKASSATDKAAGPILDMNLGLQDKSKDSFATCVNPGEGFAAPPVFIGCYQGDVDDGANRLRRWVAASVKPPARDERYPLLVNNSWGSGMAVDEPLARKMIDESAQLGLELFHIDAGWFEGVGDWRPQARKFPNGLAPIADYAHSKGLKFGLWVGWTQGGDRVDAAHRILSVRDPEMADWFWSDYPADWKPADFSGATVCLADPIAVQWCTRTLRGIIRDFKLDLLEHDQPMVVDGCQRTDHRHTRSAIDAGYRAAQGYYQVYDTLRSENPNLLFENCVNGGHMIDYGAVRRCHYISITDTYDPLSNRQAFYDAAFTLPPAMCECYIENIAVHSLAQFRSMLRSGMMGWCTIMTDTSKWTPRQHEAAKRQFALYKQQLRPLIQDGDLYHVSDRPDGVRWDGIEYFDAKTGRGALFAFRGNNDESRHALRLKGLSSVAQYALSFEDGSSPAIIARGADLMETGVELNLPERETSELVFIERR